MTRPTISGHRALHLEEPLIFERGRPGRCGVDLPEPAAHTDRLGGHRRAQPVDLPGLSEPQVVRHYTRLSQKNYGIDSGLFPLGSCTMKHNPRINEKLARLPGLADLHPLQPQSTVQGALALMAELARWIKVLTGFPALTLTPAAGAQGELCGMMAIRKALEARGETGRTRVLVPDSAHGTNPATATLSGFTVESFPSREDGRVDVRELQEHLGDDVAAVMLTNPNTCGLFETDIKEIADLIHEAGGYLYCDGANFNAICGRVRPADMGVDTMHLNLHKTFSTPHGGGGPGSGPVVFTAELAPHAPIPRFEEAAEGWRLVESDDSGASLGRLKGFHGQMGMFIRALAYMLSHGGSGLRQASDDAVLNANYLLARLKDVLTPSFPGRCMHEALFDDAFLKGTDVSTMDFAKALIDEGFHPMTVYFPLVVHGAMLVEPTESETLESLDEMCEAMLGLAERAKTGPAEDFHAAPVHAPRRRLDETGAARRPVLSWSE